MNPVFFQKYCHIIGKDVVDCALKFLNSDSFPAGLNNTHIVLIPKCKRPESITQFRPISLCNVIYRICSKVIANRLKLILPDIISNYQLVFVKNRLIADNVLVAYKVHHIIKSKTLGNNGLMSIRLDMSKAFDWIEWSFLLQTLRKLGFHESFVLLVGKCISTVDCLFLLNGDEFGHVTTSRGIRQGCPLSPYLFIICSEVFSSMLQESLRCTRLFGIQVGAQGSRISHLLFADDTLLFGKATAFEAMILGLSNSMKRLLVSVSIWKNRLSPLVIVQAWKLGGTSVKFLVCMKLIGMTNP